MVRRLSAGVLLVFAFLFGGVGAQPQVPKLEQRVTDFTNTLTYAEWKSLEGVLKKFEDTTSTQVVVLVVRSLDGASIEEYATKVFEKNNIGQSKKNNGVLLLVSTSDRKVRIEPGYGLEGVLTDALSRQIVEREMVPRFREGNYYAGLIGGVDAIMRATAGEYQADQRGKSAPLVSSALVMMIALFFFFFFLPMLASRRRYVLHSRGVHYYSGWGYGGGFLGGGSSFGGFGGFGGGGGWSGGGGMSGGGGASGSW